MKEIEQSLVAAREAISQLVPQTVFTGNAMSAINASLDNLKWEGERREKAAQEEAKAKAKELEKARQLVAEAEAAAAPVAPTPSPEAATSPTVAPEETEAKPAAE